MKEKIGQKQSDGLGKAWLSQPSKTSSYQLGRSILNKLPLWTSTARFWLLTEQREFLGSRDASTKRRPIALKMTSVYLPAILFFFQTLFEKLQYLKQGHSLPWFRLQLAQIDVPLQEQRICEVCSPRHTSLQDLQLRQLPLLTSLGVPQRICQHTCNRKPNFYPHWTARLLHHPGMTHPVYLTQEAPEPIAGRLSVALS